MSFGPETKGEIGKLEPPAETTVSENSRAPSKAFEAPIPAHAKPLATCFRTTPCCEERAWRIAGEKIGMTSGQHECQISEPGRME